MLGYKDHHTHLSWYFISWIPTKSQLHSASQELCGRQGFVESLQVCPVLVKHWLVLPLGEMKVRDSCPGRKAPGGPGMKGERFARKPAYVAPSLTSLVNRLAELMLGNSVYSRASQWQDFGVGVLHRNGLNRMKTPHGRT